MKVRIRYMELEVVNHWPHDAPDFDKKQRQITVNLDPKLPLSEGQCGLRFKIRGKSLVTEKVIFSNKRRGDGIEAFVQARLVK